MNDLVSIITPAYNAENYIEETINSVINQEYKNWEMLIVDDCSNDNTRGIIKRYIDMDNRIKLITLNVNSGVANARNIAIKKAQGRYIAFLDSDDLWKPNKLLKQISFMKTNNYHFTYSQYEIINDNSKKVNKVIGIPKTVNYNRLLMGNPIGCLTVVIDTEEIKEVEMPKINHEDYATWLNIARKGVVAHGIDENLALYRKAVNSLSSNKIKAVRWTWNIYRNNQQLGLIKSVKSICMYIVNTTFKYF